MKLRKLITGTALLVALVLTPAAIAQPGPTIVGEHVFEGFETSHPYVSSGTEAPTLTWAEQIVYPNATYIAPHFARFQLAAGDYLIVRSPDGKQSWKYTGNGRQNLGITPAGFFATHINGDSAILELFTVGNAEAYGVKVDYYGRGYSDDEIELLWDLGFGEKMNLVPPVDQGESVCTADDTEEVKCYQMSEPEAYDKARAVARLLLNGNAHCTGWLVGDEGHVMTNEHCISSQSEMNNIDFEFMAEGATCGTNCAGALACPGTIEASGGTFITDDPPLDYALVLPDTSTGTGTDLPATYGFMRLRDSGAVLNERIYLVQHPAGWGKRFAMVSTYPEDVGLGGFNYATSLTEPACAAGGPAEVGYWGDTQGGSSGSPVLGYSDHRIVALHHCRGNASCTTGTGSDDRNRGVPIDLIITDLGANLPNAAVCNPPGEPTGLSATANGDNQIDLGWTPPAVEGTLSYNVYRAAGSCPQTIYQLIAENVGSSTFSDTDVSGGSTYSYAIKTFDSTESCESVYSTCDDATATGACTLAPTFAGVTSASNDNGTSCSVTVSWDAGAANCGGSVVYNVYRSTTSGFTPDGGTLLSACVAGNSYVDSGVLSGVKYYYQVRAEDAAAANGSGPCAGGREDDNTAEASATPSGPDDVAFFDDMESGSADWTTTGTSGTAWAQVTTQSNSPTTSWFSSDQDSIKDQRLETVADYAIPAEGALLSFFHRYNTELNWDGGVLEYSTNGGTNWFDILDGDGVGVVPNANRFLAGGYSGALNSSSNPLGGRNAWHGDNGTFEEVIVDLGDFAGADVRFRWRIGCDGSVADQGWWVDDVRVATLTMCTSAELIFTDGFESGNTGNWSLVIP
jgi:hypothetical protein